MHATHLQQFHTKDAEASTWKHNVQWRQALTEALHDDERSTKAAAKWSPRWIPTLEAQRKRGRQMKRWEDEINNFIMTKKTGLNRVTTSKKYNTWQREAENKEAWERHERHKTYNSVQTHVTTTTARIVPTAQLSMHSCSVALPPTLATLSFVHAGSEVAIVAAATSKTPFFGKTFVAKAALLSNYSRLLLRGPGLDGGVHLHPDSMPASPTSRC